MLEQLNIIDISVVLAAKNNNPTLLNPDFLKINGIVPENWELAHPPFCTEPLAQVTYKKNVEIISQFDKVVFRQSSISNDLEGVEVPDVAIKYVKTLPHVNYTAVGINTNISMAINNESKIAHQFINDIFISEGPWKEFGSKQVEASVKFTYYLKDTQMNLNIGASKNKKQNEKVEPLIIFASNFHHEIKMKDIKDENGFERKIDLITNTIKNWRKDVNILTEEIIHKMLGDYLKND